MKPLPSFALGFLLGGVLLFSGLWSTFATPYRAEHVARSVRTRYVGESAYRDVALPREVHDGRLATADDGRVYIEDALGTIRFEGGSRWVEAKTSPAVLPGAPSDFSPLSLAPSGYLAVSQGAGTRKTLVWNDGAWIAGPKLPPIPGDIVGVRLVDGTIVFASGPPPDKAHVFVARPGAEAFEDIGIIETTPSYLLAGGRLGPTRAVFGFIDVVGRLRCSIVDVDKKTVVVADDEMLSPYSSWRTSPDGDLILLVPTLRKLYEARPLITFTLAVVASAASIVAFVVLVFRGRVARGSLVAGGVAGAVAMFAALFVWLATHIA